MHINDLLLKTEFLQKIKSPLEYHGYFGGFETEGDIEIMKEDKSNFLSPNNVIYIPKESEFSKGKKHFTPEQFFKDNLDRFELLNKYMAFDICVGCWNNGLFPYYERWFYEAYPDICMKDAQGKNIEASMFNEPKPWISIENGDLNIQVGEFIKDTVKRLKHLVNLVYWVNGGEMLYPTYCFPKILSDYSSGAIVHYQKWLKTQYSDIKNLNNRWNKKYNSFKDIYPPKEWGIDVETLDWHYFRQQSMAEFFRFNYECIKQIDRERMDFCIFHGDIFHNRTYADMGESVQLLGLATDGFATSQILCNAEKAMFNLLYLKIMCSMGKPVVCQALANVSYEDGRQINGTFTPWDARKSIYECLGSGVWHVGLVQWQGSLPDGDWQIYGKPVQKEVKKIFEEIEDIKPAFDYMSAYNSKTGVYIPEAQWLLKGWSKGWNNFFVKSLNEHFCYQYIFDRDILDEKFSGYKYIICYANTIIENSIISKLDGFVKNGGRLIIVEEDNDDSAFLVDNKYLGFNKEPGFLKEMVFENVLYGKLKIAKKAYYKGEILYFKAQLQSSMLDRIYYYRKTLVDYIFQRLKQYIGKDGIYSTVEIINNLENVEIFTLTDGLNMGIVLINLSNEEVSLNVKVNPKIVDLNSNYSVIDVQKKENITIRENILNIFVAPKAQKIVLIKSDLPFNLEEVRVLEDKVKILQDKGFDVSNAKYFINEVKRYALKKIDYKACALAKQISEMIFIQADSREDSISIKLCDISGNSVPGEVEVIDKLHLDKCLKVSEVNSEYKVENLKEQIGDYYDYSSNEYAPVCTDNLILKIRAKNQIMYGYSRLIKNLN